MLELLQVLPDQVSTTDNVAFTSSTCSHYCQWVYRRPVTRLYFFYADVHSAAMHLQVLWPIKVTQAAQEDQYQPQASLP